MIDRTYPKPQASAENMPPRNHGGISPQIVIQHPTNGKQQTVSASEFYDRWERLNYVVIEVLGA